jgi:hypothetical protein
MARSESARSQRLAQAAIEVTLSMAFHLPSTWVAPTLSGH